MRRKEREGSKESPVKAKVNVLIKNKIDKKEKKTRQKRREPDVIEYYEYDNDMEQSDHDAVSSAREQEAVRSNRDEDAVKSNLGLGNPLLAISNSRDLGGPLKSRAARLRKCLVSRTSRVTFSVSELAGMNESSCYLSTAAESQESTQACPSFTQKKERNEQEEEVLKQQREKEKLNNKAPEQQYILTLGNAPPKNATGKTRKSSDDSPGLSAKITLAEEEGPVAGNLQPGRLDQGEDNANSVNRGRRAVDSWTR